MMKAWKEQVKKNEGLVLSIDGIQPDKGNETIYLVRDVLTGRILTAENVTESTKERMKQVLAPVVALGLPVIGVISDAQSTELQAVADLWPDAPHQICQFHAIRERGGSFSCSISAPRRRCASACNKRRMNIVKTSTNACGKPRRSRIRTSKRERNWRYWKSMQPWWREP